MKRVIGNIIFVIYAIIAIFVTVCLLSFNQYKVSEFGNASFVLIDSNETEPDFTKGDLVIPNKKDLITVGDKVFFYNTYGETMEVTLGEVTNAQRIVGEEITYTINGELQLSSEYVLGSAETAERIPVVGSILSVLESKWGFLFLIVFPSLIAFIYEIYVVVSEIRGKKNEKSSGKKQKAD